MKKLFLLTLLFASSIYSQTQKDLCGSWQAAPNVASGYDDTFTFNEDGTFYYFNNQMDCSKREVGYGGFWELKGKSIELVVTYYDLEKGGHLKPSDGSCGSDSMLVGSEIVKTNVVPYELTVLKLSNYGKEMKDETERFTIEINNRKHWYFSKFEY